MHWFTVVALLIVAMPACAQSDAPLSAKEKLKLHAGETCTAGFAVEMAAYSGILHWMNVPTEWEQGGAAYGKRLASASAATGIRNLFAFTLDAALHEDPRYQRSGHGNVLRRSGHALREIFVTRTDRGGRRFATWRFGSAVGAAYLSNLWYPDRLRTVESGLEQGAATIGLDLLGNLASEFWPDIKRKLLRHR